MRRLDLATVAIVLLVLFAILHVILPHPWGSLAGAAAVAALAAMLVDRLFFAPKSTAKTPTAEQVVSEVSNSRAAVRDMIAAHQEAGFDEDEAKSIVRDHLRAQAPTSIRVSTDRGTSP